MTGQKTPFLAIFDQNTQKLIYPINYNSSHKLLFIPFDKVNGMNGPELKFPIFDINTVLDHQFFVYFLVYTQDFSRV